MQPCNPQVEYTMVDPVFMFIVFYLYRGCFLHRLEIRTRGRDRTYSCLSGIRGHNRVRARRGIELTMKQSTVRAHRGIPKGCQEKIMTNLSELEKFFVGFDNLRAFPHQKTVDYPKFNLSKVGDQFLIEVALPGWTRDQVSLTLHKNQLLIKRREAILKRKGPVDS